MMSNLPSRSTSTRVISSDGIVDLSADLRHSTVLVCCAFAGLEAKKRQQARTEQKRICIRPRLQKVVKLVPLKNEESGAYSTSHLNEARLWSAPLCATSVF